MNDPNFGFWAMIAFWASAVGGIVIGISWARGRRRNPVPRKLLVKSLQSRLEAGEITREEYDRKLGNRQAGLKARNARAVKNPRQTAAGLDEGPAHRTIGAIVDCTRTSDRTIVTL